MITVPWWAFLAAGWGLVIALNVFCFWKILFGKTSDWGDSGT